MSNIWKDLVSPDYDSVIARYEFEKERGRAELEKHGYAIGDTVYLDGKLKGIIYRATVSITLFEWTSDMIIFIKVDAKAWREHTGSDDHKNADFVALPCTIADIQKEPNNDK